MAKKKNKEVIEVVESKPKKEEKQKNYVRNYLVLIAVFIAFAIITLYLCKLYKVYEDYQKETPIIRDSLYEIKSEDLDHYVVDTSDVIIYMCTANDDACRFFEKDFKKYVNKNDVAEYVTYLNLTGTDLDEFAKNFNQQYHSKVKFNGHYPAFVAFQDGNVVSILQGNKNKKLSITKVHNFLELYLHEEENSVEGEEEAE